MAINTTAGLLDAIVLAVVGREETGTYGYKITQEVRTVLDLSESTLYPVLRRLQRDGCLTVHDEAFNGRNNRDDRNTEKILFGHTAATIKSRPQAAHGWQSLPPSGKPTPQRSTSSLRGSSNEKIRVLIRAGKAAVCPAC